MIKLSPKLGSATFLAALSSPLTILASSAKDLTPAELANMSQASAVRIGCGVSVGLPNDLSGLGQALSGAVLASGLALVAIRFLPEPWRTSSWRTFKTSALILFLAGAPLSPILLSMPFFTNVMALWLVSSLIAVPIVVRSIWRTTNFILRSTVSAARKGLARFNQLSVRVDGNTVTLRQGLSSQTRVVEQSLSGTAGEKEEEACLTH